MFSILNRISKLNSVQVAVRPDPASLAAKHTTSGKDDGPLRPRSSRETAGADDMQSSVSPLRAKLPTAGQQVVAAGAGETLVPLKGDSRPTTERYTQGPLPPPGPLRTAHLLVSAHWRPERRVLHERLIGEATTGALKFAEVVEQAKQPPTLFALRGNTAAGKTSMAKNAHPVMADALKASGGEGVINPDIFKRPLRENSGPAKLNTEHVHEESSMLALRLEAELKTMKTQSGLPASMLVDRRLAEMEKVDRCLNLAEQTGRKVELCDIDAPLERSLAGVLMRKPEGDDPVPPFRIVANGFTGVRGNRLDVIDKLIAKPELGGYQLFGTAEDGSRVKVASVERGELSIHDPRLYERITAPESAVVGHVGEQVIDARLIDHMASSIDDPERAAGLRTALQRYEGMTWAQAVDAHCARSK